MAAFRPDLLQSNHLAIIGGGYIGLETAAVARSMGLEVTLIQRSARLMGRATASVTSEFFARYHMDRGVKLMLRRSEEHTSEHQSLMRISYAVFCLKKNNEKNNRQIPHVTHQIERRQD